MSTSSEEIVNVATGTLIEMNELAELLQEAGIHGRVVGDDLTAGLGTMLPGSVELWVLSADAQKTKELIQAKHGHHHNPHSQGHAPVSASGFGSQPDTSQGPHRMPEPYRKSP